MEDPHQFFSIPKHMNKGRRWLSFPVDEIAPALTMFGLSFWLHHEMIGLALSLAWFGGLRYIKSQHGDNIIALAIKSLLNLLLTTGFLAMLITNLVLAYTSYQALTHQSRTLVPPYLEPLPSLTAMLTSLILSKWRIIFSTVTLGSVGRQFGHGFVA